MKHFAFAWLAALTLAACGVVSSDRGGPASAVGGLARLQLLSGGAAIEPAFLRIVVAGPARGPRAAQALPASWGSALVRLHATDPTARLTQDRVVTLEPNGFSGGTTSSPVFMTLRPGNYLFQVTLFTGAGATGTSAAVQTLDLNLQGGVDTTVTVTLDTTVGTGSSGGTALNTQVSDATGVGSVVSEGVSLYNSVLGGPTGVPIVVAGDTLLLDPQLADSTATGGGSATSGSTATPAPGLDPGVLSRVLLTYSPTTVTPTGPNLVASESILTDWVRPGDEPIRGVLWTTLANSTDGGTWPALGSATRTGAGTFAGTFNWNTSPTTFLTAPLFTSEASLSANYQLTYRYYDDTYAHNLIAIQSQGLAVEAPANLSLTVQ